MKRRVTTFIVTLIFAALCICTAWCRTVVVLAGSGPECVQYDYARSLLPWPVEPNVIQGVLLPPICRDPNTWELPCGKWNRAGYWCDPNAPPGSVITMRLVEGTSPAAITVDPNGTWVMATELMGGLNAFVVEARDDQGGVTVATILVAGLNEPPVLE